MDNQNIDNKIKNKNKIIIILSVLIIILSIVLIIISVNNKKLSESQNAEIEKLNTDIRILKHDLKEKNEAVAIRKLSGNYVGKHKYQNYTSNFELLLNEDGSAEYCISTTKIKCNRGTYVIDGKNITLSSKETVKNEKNSQTESNEFFKFTYDDDVLTTQDISNNVITLNKTEAKLTMTGKYFK